MSAGLPNVRVECADRAKSEILVQGDCRSVGFGDRQAHQAGSITIKSAGGLPQQRLSETSTARTRHHAQLRDMACITGHKAREHNACGFATFAIEGNVRSSRVKGATPRKFNNIAQES